MTAANDLPGHAQRRALRLGFLLLPRFSLLALAGASEAVRQAGLCLAGRAAQDHAAQDHAAQDQVLICSLEGQAVQAGCATRVAVDAALPAVGRLDALFVFSDMPLPQATHDGHAAVLHPALRAHAASGATLAGVGTGAAVLAQAGMLAGYRATLPYSMVAQMAAQHPEVVWSCNVYEMDRQRLSCADGAASLDLLIAWLAQRHGAPLAQLLVAHFGLERLRAKDERQRTPMAARLGASNAKLAEAVALMEANLGEPLPTDDIARLVGVSRRQLERLFKQHLGELPSRYYAELRLVLSQRLLQHTSQSVLQIALACGFASGSHFSNAYRARFERTPRDERSQRAGAWRAATEDTAP